MTSIQTRSVTINAAFLREIKEDNRELRALLDQATEVFAVFKRSGRPTLGPKQLVELLGRLRDQLAIHFSLEEAYGYFDDAVSVAPRLSRQIEQLRAEHETLFTRFCDVHESCEQLLYHEMPNHTFKRISHRFDDFLNAFTRHEAEESSLIYDALQEDIGIGD